MTAHCCYKLLAPSLVFLQKNSCKEKFAAVFQKLYLKCTHQINEAVPAILTDELFSLGSHGPLLPLPSRYRMASRDTPELVAYPLPQASSSYMHGGNPSGSVVMVSGLHQQKMNCSRVFNLFCLYGNIEKVKKCNGNSIEMN